jgi:hypothetical protein
MLNKIKVEGTEMTIRVDLLFEKPTLPQHEL